MKKKSYKKELINYLRKEMDKIPCDDDVKKLKQPFGFCYAQAKFDILIEIDTDLGLNAFITEGGI